MILWFVSAQSGVCLAFTGLSYSTPELAEGEGVCHGIQEILPL